MMWQQGWREQIWSGLDREWDMLVIGGGITGAGIARLAAAYGLEVLLVEARDFAFGTSSRSSKLAHGGFRYLYNRQYQVTYESVQQREELLREAAGLVTPLAFNLPNYENYHISSGLLHCGVIIYDLMAPKWDHRKLDAEQVRQKFQHLKTDDMLACFRYQDAVLDDARLVLRVIREAAAAGAAALNYARVENLLRDRTGKVRGVALRDTACASGNTAEVKAKVVVNASGPWTDEIRANLSRPARLRKLRGSHLIFDRARLPIPGALTIFHPADGRAMFALPWEGASLVGTTDVDHAPELEAGYQEPFASQAEMDYILSALDFLFPSLHLNPADIVSSFAGLRPIINTGAATPSKESRAHQVWNEDGLITITGGKLTTFRLMARQSVAAALAECGLERNVPRRARFIDALSPCRKPIRWMRRCSNSWAAGMAPKPARCWIALGKVSWNRSDCCPTLGQNCALPLAVRASFIWTTCCCGVCAWACCCRKAGWPCCRASAASYNPNWVGAISVGKQRKKNTAVSGKPITAPRRVNLNHQAGKDQERKWLKKTLLNPIGTKAIRPPELTVPCSSGTIRKVLSIPTRVFYRLLRDTFGMRDEDFIYPKLDIDPLDIEVPCGLALDHLREFSRIVGDENIKTDTYSRIKASYGAGMLDALRLRRKDH
jgi:Glycerol-3-phosphate dehydrogenase